MLGFAWGWNRLPCLAITTSTHSYHQCQAQPCPTGVWWDSPVTSPLFVNHFKDMGIPHSSEIHSTCPVGNRKVLGHFQMMGLDRSSENIFD